MIERLVTQAVKRGEVEVAGRVEAEVYESGWLSLSQGMDCIVIEPEQLVELMAFILKHDLAKLKAENKKAWSR